MKNFNSIYTSLAAFVVGFFVCIVSFNNWKSKSDSTQIAINGPSNAAVGEIIEYEATVTNKPSGSDVIFQWQVLRDGQPISFRSMGDNSVLFGSGQKNNRCLIILNGVTVSKSLFVFTDVKPIKAVFKEVIIGNVPPGPNPIPPGPGPNPSPTPVDGRFKIANLVYSTAMSKVTNPNRAQLFADISKNYLTVVDLIDQNKLLVVQQIFGKLKELNGPLFTSKYADCVDQYKEYDKVIQQYLYQLYTDKTLTKISDYPDLFREIVSGLGFVR